MPTRTTQGVTVEVTARYLPRREEDGYAFAYDVTIRNDGDVAVRLHSRHWVITDANGEIREVEGEGVVGQQPTLEPGGAFSYTSWATLGTPIGTMKGAYRMVTREGASFQATIPEFILNANQTIH